MLKDVPHTIKDKQIDPKRAKSRPICKKVFVGGIDGNLSEEEIRKYFSRYGKVEQVELPIDRVRGKRREFVFIIYEDEMSAELACREPKQHIGDRDCDIKKAQPQPVAQQQKQRAQAIPGAGFGSDGYGSRDGSRPPRGRGGGYGGFRSGPSQPSYGSSAYSDSGYASGSGSYGWEGYGYGAKSVAPSSGGDGYADYYAGYYGQGYDYGRTSAAPSNAYYGYPSYEGGDGYAAAGYGPDYYTPPTTSAPGGKMVRGKSSSSGQHPYSRSGHPPHHS